MSNGSTTGGMVTSGLIAAAIGAAVTVALSLVIPFPWDLSRTLISVAIASFCGAAFAFQRGNAAGRRSQ